MASYLEKILTRQTPRELSKNIPNQEMDFQVSYDHQITAEADKLYNKNKLFNEESLHEDSIAPVVLSRLSKKIKKIEMEETTGDKWFGMKKQILTPEMKDQLNLLKMRGYIDPKSFSKKSDWKELPEYFQMGTVLDGGDEPKAGRIPKSERRGNLIDQFLDYDQDISWTKDKFKEIQAKKKQVVKKKLGRFKQLKKRGVVRG